MMKNYFLKNRFVFLLALALQISSFFFYIYFTDISMVSPTESKTNDLKVYLTFSNGEAHHANANYALTKAINKKFDILISYKQQHIDQKFFEENKHILNQKRGSGYWLWKPYFILKTLESLPEGSIIMYNDAGLSFSGDIDHFIQQINTSKKDLVFFNNFHINRGYVKKETYKFMKADETLCNKTQLDASSIIIRKSPQSVEFIKKWLKLCKDERLLTDKKFSDEPEDKDFIDHRHDQAILTLLYYTEPHNVLILTKKQQDLFFHHRRRNIQDCSLSIRQIKKNLMITINAFWASVKSNFA